MPSSTVEERAMKAGDHIRITKDGSVEHAIDVGDRTVLHFARGAGVKRSRLAELAPNGARVDVVTHAERVYPAKQVVARAFSRFSEAAYAAMFPDSEAFAVWCKTGQIPPRASGASAGAAIAPATQGAGTAPALGAAATAVSEAKAVKKIARGAKQAVKAVAGRAQEARPVKAAPRAKPAPARKAPARRAAAKGARPQAARSAKPARKPAPAKPARATKASKRGAAPRKATPGKRGKAPGRRVSSRGKRR